MLHAHPRDYTFSFSHSCWHSRRHGMDESGRRMEWLRQTHSNIGETNVTLQTNLSVLHIPKTRICNESERETGQTFEHMITHSRIWRKRPYLCVRIMRFKHDDDETCETMDAGKEHNCYEHWKQMCHGPDTKERPDEETDPILRSSVAKRMC